MGSRARERANRLWWVGTSNARRLAAMLAGRLSAGLLPAAAFAVLALLALIERPRTAWRRMRGARPRLIWGPSAILNVKYWSEAMRSVGYESVTCIDIASWATKKDDFDVHRDDLIERSRLPGWLRQYAVFIWALRNGDVFLRYFDGGFLRGTPLEWRECPLLRLAGKRLVLSPYGGDIAVPGHLGIIEEATFADYPDLPDYAPMIKRRVLHALRWANVSIRNYQAGFQPGYNVVWPTQLGIDTELWSPDGETSEADGREGEVVVLHAPNHRRIKGTEHLERAVSELRDEGLRIDLQILERRPNEALRAVMPSADIVADQFLDPGYALFSIEAMAAGKPVLCRMSPISEELRTASLEECPIVDAAPENLQDNLRRLVEDPTLRRELGRRGREFVVRHHSPEAMGREWDAIIAYAWRGASLPERLAPRQSAASES